MIARRPPTTAGTLNAMASANVEIVRKSFEEWVETGQVAYGHLHPEIEWFTRPDLPDSAPYNGHEGVASLTQAWNTSFEDPRFEVQDYIDRGEAVVVPLILRGRIRGSEQDVEMPETWVVWLRDGMVVEVREYPALDEGLRAADSAPARGSA